MITGEDTVVVVGVPDLATAVGRALDALGRKWPDMLVSINDGERQHEFAKWWAGSALPQGSGDVMVARDAATREAWDELGYFTDLTGQGPLTIYYEPCRSGLIKASLLEEPYRRARRYGFDPFEAALMGDGCSVLTLVTSDEAPAFRDQVLALLSQAVVGLVQ